MTGKSGGRCAVNCFFDHALLPAGWARDVRISVTTA